jgi:lipoate-protein ligase A
MPPIGIVRLARASLMQQLRLEEALLRSTTRSWFVVSWDPRTGAEERAGDGGEGAPPPPLAARPTPGGAATTTPREQAPTIVLGISGKPAELIDLPLCVGRRGGGGGGGCGGAETAAAAAIRRFSGGGTVVVGPGTVLTSLVVSREDLERREIDPYPHPLMRWTAKVYARAFEGRGGRGGGGEGGGGGGSDARPPSLALNENDYCFGDLKIAGNAQAITGGRVLHHTSFLWDWREEHMRLLLPPKKQPEYRRRRAHGAFLSRVRDALPGAFPRPQDLALALEEAVVREWGGGAEDARAEELAEALRGRHLRGNRWVDLEAEAEAEAAAAARPRRAADAEREARGGSGSGFVT